MALLSPFQAFLVCKGLQSGPECLEAHKSSLIVLKDNEQDAHACTFAKVKMSLPLYHDF